MSPNLVTNQITIWFQTLKQGSDVTIETIGCALKVSLIFAAIIPGTHLGQEELLAMKSDPETTIYDQVAG